MQSHRMERFVRKALPALMAVCLIVATWPVGLVAAQDAPDSAESTSAIAAHPAAVEITAVDALTGLPLSGCLVRIGDSSALTSADGVVELEAPSGWFEIAASAQGFQDLTLTLQQVSEGQRLERELLMAPRLAVGQRADLAEERVETYLTDLASEWSADDATIPEDISVPLADVVAPPETIRLITNGVWNGGFSTDGPAEVVTLDMDEYLKGVVPMEVSNLWPAESLKAQAVAARSYASTHINRHSSIGGDVCNTVHCQAWSPAHYSQTDLAVEQTSGEVARYDDAIISAFFFGHCDGNTRNSEDVWYEALPYCRSVPCECGYTTMWGHGVGMCQRGAQAMAERGANYVEILTHYYTDAVIGAGNPRVWGSDRYSTSVETARLAFDPDEDGSWPGVTEIVIASGEDRAAADPLSAAGLVWAYDAPIFLIDEDFVPNSVRAAVAQIASAGQPITVHVVGGNLTVPQARLAEIDSAAGSTDVEFDRIREDGDRYDMAATIALRVQDEWESRNGAGSSPSVALLANGADSTKFFDALALSAIAADEGFPILLVSVDSVPWATNSALNALDPAERIVSGGSATVSDAVVTELGGTRVSGSDRYRNAIAAADYAEGRGWLEREYVGVSAKLPDALCAGAIMGRLGGVSLVTQGDDLNSSVYSWLASHREEVEECYIFGGPVSVTGAVDADITRALSGSTASGVSGTGVFPDDSFWYARVDSLPVHTSSAAWVDTIGRDVYMHPDFGSGLWDGGPIGIPITYVGAGQPDVDVTFDYSDESDPGPYPIPPGALIEGGPASSGDRHVLVVDEDAEMLYELFDAHPQTDGSWTAGSGAIFDLTSNALRPDGWTSADAAGLAIAPGLVTYDEVASGEVAHAIRVTAPQTASSHIWPARHDASALTGAQYPPMGARFRLKDTVDIGAMSSDSRIIAQALKDYGMILCDNGASWYISGTPDERWDNDVLRELRDLTGDDFEAVQTSAMMVSPDSGQAR